MPSKTSRWGPNQQSGLLAVDRPMVRFLTIMPAVDLCLANDPAVDRPVDRAISESRGSLAVDRAIDRP